MSSLSPTDARARPVVLAAVPPDTLPLRVIGVGACMALALFVQLDAVANRLSAGSPVSLFMLLLGMVVVLALVVVLTPLPSVARGDTGARLIVMLLLWAVFAWTLSEHRSEGVDYLIKTSTAVMPALAVLALADRSRHILLIVWAMIAAGLISAAIVLIEARTGTRLVATALAATTADYEGVARSSGGSDQNPTTAAQMLMTSAALALGLLFAGDRRGRTVLIAVVAIGAAALAAMSARSAILGFAAAGGFVLLRFRGKAYFPLLLLAGAGVGAVGLFFAPPTLLARFAAIGDFAADPTLFRRITYLRIGADLVGQSPIWGVGPGNFPLYYVTDAYRFMPGRFPEPRELHNSYVDTAAEYGLVGLAIFVALIGYALMSARRAFVRVANDELARVAFAVAVALAGLLVACFFMPHKDMRYLWLMLALAIQCGRIRDGERAT